MIPPSNMQDDKVVEHADVARSHPDVLLLFPVATEARLFPYLSLPSLTAYLRRHGADVRQRDLNIELSHALFTPDILRRYLAKTEVGTDVPALKVAYRAAMARYLLETCDDLVDRTFDKGARDQGGGAALRLVSQGIELLLEGSLLKRIPTSPNEIAELLESSAEVPEDDLAARALEGLLENAMGPEVPRIVGISVAFHSQLWPALFMARWIRKRFPGTLVVLGGQQIMLRHEMLARIAAVKDAVHALGTGAGEATLVALVRAISGKGSFADVPSITWLDGRAPSRVDRAVPIAQLPPPDFSDLPWTRYLMDEVQFPLVTCIGCFWGRCAFCSYGNRSRRDGYQQKSPRQIARECEHIVRRYAGKRINFVDEMTNLPVICAAMKLLAHRGIRFEFSVRCRFEKRLCDIHFCRELRKLGCVQMAVGYETNVQRLLDKLDKGVDAADYQIIIDNLHEVGIELRLSVMGGIMDETPEELAASQAFLQKNSTKFGIDVMQMLICEPGTRMHEHPDEYGITVEDPDRWMSNTLLSYGHGRVGRAFHVPDGASFEQRQERFLSIYHGVRPAKNDDVPPEHRANAVSERIESIHAIELNPWVCVLEACFRENVPEVFLVNLIWQTTYRLPRSVRLDGQRLVAVDHHGTNVLSRLLVAGAGTPIVERRSA